MKKDRCLFLCIFFLFLMVRYISPAYAVDEVVLSGTLRSVDLRHGTAVVEVHSGSCPGSKKFRTDDAEYLSKLLDREISFRIDSNTCSNGQMHSMHDVVLQRKGVRP